ncbi:efflux RND transporter permease subunit [Nguyenibacter sp. L1]|uniref:efflux RND transporter permease subunit n=1 Tax=Nguyenibacter sp. L1 TaxID=3049350 RepID=UPI002B45AF2A|nr:efflux RND transporter permease subunit [Nguyenibacter sp. L1]WRH88858.1 efflux RND transporter permease subunit [Nguyenibacter sp. L1]
MSLIALCVRRPIGTILIVVGLMIGGGIGYWLLPIADLPNVDFPVIQVRAQQPGGTPEEMASTIAEPLERHLGVIAGLNQMTSQSVNAQVTISLQFDLSRDVNGAARDVQAAIQAARADLPATLRQNPTYVKANSAGAPIMVLTLTSPTRTTAQLYDAATNILQQHLSQVSGVGQVLLGGSALPAVRVEMNPLALFKYGIGFEDVRAALASANADTPKGYITRGARRLVLRTNDQVRRAKDLQGLIIAYRNDRPVRLTDVASVTDGVEDVLNAGYYNRQPAVLAIIFPEAGANVVHTIDQIRARFPVLTAVLPADVAVHVGIDRSVTIRSALADTRRTLILAVVLVVVVVLLFLRSPRTTIVPAVVIPASLVATFGVMELLHYSLDSLSLMALTIATGFVVDDAIVVIENISRYMEAGMPRRQAVLRGAGEVAFTVFSISVSLVAVFLPILLLGGLMGRLLHEFAVTISTTVLVSMGLSLTLTPMMCARLLRAEPSENGPPARALARAFARLHEFYARTLVVALRHRRLVLLSLPVTIAAMGGMFAVMPKGLFPTADTGMLMAHLLADQATSFTAMRAKMDAVQRLLLEDPDVTGVTGFIGGRNTANQASIFLQLTDKGRRHGTLRQTLDRLDRRTSGLVGSQFIALAPGMLTVGARQGNAAYQYTLESDDAALLYTWMPRLLAALQHDPQIRDLSSDVQQGGLAVNVAIDRDMAARTGVTPQLIANTLYDAFGQRAASIIYNPLNQYRVVMNVRPEYWADPAMLRQVWVSLAGGTAGGGTQSNTIRLSSAPRSSAPRSSAPLASAPLSSSPPSSSSGAAAQDSQSFANQIKNGLAGGNNASSGSAVSGRVETQVPLPVVADTHPGSASLSVNHQGQALAATVAFNLAPGASIADAARIIRQEEIRLNMPAAVHGNFAGTAAQVQSATRDEPLLILAALAAVYMVLGILYESYVHPLTILSTLPSAGVGALLALDLYGQEFDLIALIGMILLVGIVKKNAIMLVDFAITEQRRNHRTPQDAIHAACLLRFRPIMMTTLAAAMGATPLIVGSGYGAELRRPLGIAIVGGLLVSQALTLYTTPVVYLYLDRLGAWGRRVLPPAFRALARRLRPARP